MIIANVESQFDQSDSKMLPKSDVVTALQNAAEDQNISIDAKVTMALVSSMFD
jgi:hypothetical protein